MYAYRFNEINGGITLLDDDTVLHSNEPRPVYANEMDLLGMDQFWNYSKQNDIPYMWAEAANYWYRGKKIARVKGGSLYEDPVLELSETLEPDNTSVAVLPIGSVLLPMDLDSMVADNMERLAILEQITLKKIYNYYKKYEHKLDCFHVAFSGGKDSIVLLDLVSRALPKFAYIVVFGDTGMEFPDTYDVVDKVEDMCKKEGIEFYRATSHLDSTDSWKIFGAPSKVLRWCCTVHKATPQTLKIREIIGKSDYVGADFVGVRKYESLNRANYEYESYGKKQKGQYSQNPILDWSSAEIWLYIYTHKLIINEAYKKGNSRAGCLFCPMGSGKSDFFRRSSYPNEIKKYTDLIRQTVDDSNLDSYISNGGWINRKNGRDLIGVEAKYTDEVKNGYVYITVKHPSSDWQEWIKTLGDIPFRYSVEDIEEGYVVKVADVYNKTTDMKYFKQVFHKAAYCIGCKVCEANCPNGCISFGPEGVKIKNCIHCKQCHNIDSGCLLYHSIQLPRNGGKVMSKSINCFADHAPKMEWIIDFFDKGDEFFDNNGLGPNQKQMFRRFLDNAMVIKKNKLTDFGKLIMDLGIDSIMAWNLILINLVYDNPQMQWYVKQMPINELFPRKYLEELLVSKYGLSDKDSKSVVKSFKRITDTPIGTLTKFGYANMSGIRLESVKRTKGIVGDSLVVLYCLFRFAEACNGYYQFTLGRLMDTSIDSAGISPVEIFGFDSGIMEQYLNNLSVKYPEFINATFTHDLEKISLAEDKTSLDVLKLIEV